MRKKYNLNYKTHKRTIRKPIFIIAIILIICSLMMAAGYAYFTEKVTIHGTANGTWPPLGKSTYTWSAPNSWGNGVAGNLKWYQLKIKINNNDGAKTAWTISFNTQSGLVDKNIWCASESTITTDSVSMTSFSWNGTIADGGSRELEFQLGFASMEPLSITNLVFCSKKATDVNT